MARFKNALYNLIRDEEGATMVEYALVVALIAVVCIGAAEALGGSASTKLTEASDAIGGG